MNPPPASLAPLLPCSQMTRQSRIDAFLSPTMARKKPQGQQQGRNKKQKNPAQPQKNREPRAWSVDSQSVSDAGSEEGTPERLGAVRLEVGKSQLNWGDRHPSSESGSSSGTDEGQEEEKPREKRRVMVSGDEAEPEVINLDTEDEQERATKHIPPPSSPKRRHPPSGGLDDMFLSSPESSHGGASSQPAPTSSYTRAAKHPPRSSPPALNGKRAARLRRRTPTPSESESTEDPETIVASPPPYRRAPPVVKRGKRDTSPPPERKKRRKGKSRAVDPDESEEEEQDPEALVRELEMDEPVVVETRLRERNKKTPHQIRLEALKRRSPPFFINTYRG